MESRDRLLRALKDHKVSTRELVLAKSMYVNEQRILKGVALVKEAGCLRPSI